jgi:hypothetical protein
MQVRYRNSLRGKVPRFLYVGALGEHNLGDEVLYVAAQRLLGRRTGLVTALDREAEARLEAHGLTGPAFFDGVIVGGGTLISPSWLQRIESLASLGCPTWTLGTGVGSCGTFEPNDVSLEGWPDLLHRMAGVSVRGPLSRAKLRALGFHDARVVGDLACEMTLPRPLPVGSQPSIMLNIAGATDDLQLATLRTVTEQLRAIMAAGTEIVPVAMSPSDLLPTRRILEASGAVSPHIYLPTTFDDFSRLVGVCRFGIAVRLHATILAACVGVPTVMLGYRDKCLDFMSSVGREELYVSLYDGTADETRAAVTKLLHAPNAARGHLLQSMQTLQSALRHYAASLFTTGAAHD